MIDRLAKNGIDLTRRPIEVAPIAHYHMGGIRVDERMETRIEGLFAAGEAVGGANGANRLSGNAIPEAFVFGERAGRFAAERGSEAQAWRSEDDARAERFVDDAHGSGGGGTAGLGALLRELQALMWDDVGLLRTQEGLTRALGRIREMRDGPISPPSRRCARRVSTTPCSTGSISGRLCLAAESVALSALNRKESRGAHQREDFVETDPAYRAQPGGAPVGPGGARMRLGRDRRSATRAGAAGAGSGGVSAETVTIRVRRGTPEEPSRIETFAVPTPRACRCSTR